MGWCHLLLLELAAHTPLQPFERGWVPGWVLPQFPQLFDDGVMVHSTHSGVLLAWGALMGTSPHGEGGVHHDAPHELVVPSR